MMGSEAVREEGKDLQEVEKRLRESMEFDLYNKANRFVDEKIVKNEYRISKTRLENLARAFGISYAVFDKLINNYLIRLEREVKESSDIRSASAQRELEILKEIKAQCDLNILKGISLGLEDSVSRSERTRQNQLRKEYAGRLAHAWFTHFFSAYMYKVRLKEEEELSATLTSGLKTSE